MAHTPSLSALTLGLGLTANAWFFFGNLGEALMGPASIISSPEKRNRYGLDADKSSEMFDTFYHYAAPRFGSASAIASTSYLLTAYLKRNDLTSTFSNSLLTTAGILALFPLPWTVFIMMPTNKSIIAKSTRNKAGDVKVNSEKNLAEFDREIQKWVGLNFIRYSVLGLSYFTALYSVLVDL